MNLSKLHLATLVLFALAGCSDDAGDREKAAAKNDHIWKAQTRTLERAKGVETVIMDAAKQRQEQIDQQGR